MAHQSLNTSTAVSTDAHHGLDHNHLASVQTTRGCLTDGQEVTGIIDGDHLPLAARGYDLGYYLAFGVR